MNTIFTLDDGSFSINGLIEVILTVIFIVLFNLTIYKIVKRKVPNFCVGCFSVLFLVGTIFEFKYVSLVALMGTICVSLVSLIANMATIRAVVANIYSSPKKPLIHGKKIEDKKKEDKLSTYKTINEAVIYLAKHKIGALITFERKDNLDNILKNGSTLSCPVNYELLITIFYPGTRLHDGAVVIRDNEIIAASVYYTPTTKPLVGKYGSRHRAAIGISEICDAVTVVVSEETGKISIAYDGELDTYSQDNFLKAFENIMDASIESN